MEIQMQLRGRDIVRLLETNDKAIARALVVLRANQTSDEQKTKHTKHKNMTGFRPCDARVGTEMAEFYLDNGYLTPQQIAYWRRPYKKGGIRISIYWRQLLRAAHQKQRQSAAA
jgi:hypothetical protein